LSREKLWLDGLDGDERAIIKGLKEESTRLGRRLGFLFMVSQIGSQRTAQVNAYGLDEEAIQGLPRTRGCQLIAAVALMDAAGKEMAVKRVVFSPGSLGNSIFDHFVVLSVREEDFEGWPLLGVWPGFRGGEYGDLVQACYGNLYFDATSDELKQVQKMNLSVRWEP
jgi:hypothetical protein